MTADSILVNPSHIATNDRSVQYGDACFTSMYAHSGSILLHDQHIERLKTACDALQITFNDWDKLQSQLHDLTPGINTPSVIKVLISRGSGGRGYQPPQVQSPNCIITTHSTQDISTPSAVDLVAFSDLSLPNEPWAKGVKHCNRLAQVLSQNISKQSINAKVSDVLMCNNKQHVIEASSANVFYSIDGVWYTPPIRRWGVKGIMRDAYVDYLVNKGIHVNESFHHKSVVANAEQILLSNAVKGIRPVAQLIFNGQKRHLDTQMSHDLRQDFLSNLLMSGSRSI